MTFAELYAGRWDFIEHDSGLRQLLPLRTNLPRLSDKTGIGLQVYYTLDGKPCDGYCLDAEQQAALSAVLAHSAKTGRIPAPEESIGGAS